MSSVKGPPPPLLRLLDLSTRRLADELLERQARAGFRDIRPAHNHVFAHVPPEGIRLTELAERASMTKQAMGEIVDDLERLGYVERRPDPVDGRAKTIHFTDRGWTAVRAGLRSLADIERTLARRFGAERVRELRSMLEAIGGEG